MKTHLANEFSDHNDNRRRNVGIFKESDIQQISATTSIFVMGSTRVPFC